MKKAMKRAISYVLLLLSAAGAAWATASEGVATWLPLDRLRLFGVLSKGMDMDLSALQTLEQYLSKQRSELEANPKNFDRLERELTRLTWQRKLRSPDDTIWLVRKAALPFSIVMAGTGGNIHSLRVTVPLVNNTEEANETALNVLSDLFVALYPDWLGARDWPRQSLEEAWNNHPFVRKKPLNGPNDLFIRKTNSGITSTTFGAPPDVVVYTVTVRERCIPVYAQGNSFERLIC